MLERNWSLAGGRVLDEVLQGDQGSSEGHVRCSFACAVVFINRLVIEWPIYRLLSARQPLPPFPLVVHWRIDVAFLHWCLSPVKPSRAGPSRPNPCQGRRFNPWRFFDSRWRQTRPDEHVPSSPRVRSPIPHCSFRIRADRWWWWWWGRGRSGVGGGEGMYPDVTSFNRSIERLQSGGSHGKSGGAICRQLTNKRKFNSTQLTLIYSAN